MRSVGVVTVSRSDYGIYAPLLKAIRGSADLELRLIVGGTHLSREFGLTVEGIVADGFEIAAQVDTLPASDEPAGLAEAAGKATTAFASALRRCRPDVLVVLGDRFEMLAAAFAALPQAIPLAHIHGGELTEGAIDDAFRHCITKLSHLHFVANETYARRVRQLGEEPWRVVVSGALSLDDLTTDLRSLEEIGARWHLRLTRPLLLVTYHPVTLEPTHVETHVRELLEGLSSFEGSIVFTGTNVDTHYRAVRAAIWRFVLAHANASYVENLGRRDYTSLMALADAMIGNSSSGIIEAPTLGLPVVNVGIRQQGRIRAENVIDVADDAAQIATGIRRALEPAFRERLVGTRNPYGDGHATTRIIERLSTVPLDETLLAKRFLDWEERP